METFSALLAFVRGIQRPPVNSPHKGQWHRALMFSLICVWIKRLSQQSRGWWFETLSSPLWRHCNVYHSIISGIWFLCLLPIFIKLTHWHKHINRILLENIVIQFAITLCAKLSVITICFKAERVITILLTPIKIVNIIIFIKMEIRILLPQSYIWYTRHTVWFNFIWTV